MKGHQCSDCMFLWKDKQNWSIIICIKNIEFPVSQLTRDHMWKYDKSKHLSENSSVKNNF